MNEYHALLLGLVQGLTEFLPVSSSGHLVILQAIMGLDEPPLIFDLILHGGTLVTVLVYFRRELSLLIRGSLTGDRDMRRYVGYVLAATVATAVVGLSVEEFAEQAFLNPSAAGIGLLITATVLAVGSWKLSTSDERPPAAETGPASVSTTDIGLLAALAVGVAQGMAVFPGISRAGFTIVVGLLVGLRALEAFRFSFLLSIPAIAGGLVLKSTDLAANIGQPGRLQLYLLGALLAATSGLGALVIVRRFLDRARWSIFAAYCLLAGLLTLMLV